MIKPPPKPVLPTYSPQPSYQYILPNSSIANQTETLTPGEQELLQQYCAQASPATFATESPLVIDPIL